MLFREEYTLHDLGLTEGETLDLSGASPYPTSLSIRRPAKQEQTKVKSRECLGIVQTEEPVADKVAPHFANFENPHPAVVDIGTRVGSRLHDYVVRAACVLRWRTGFTTHPNPIVNSRLLHWTDDGKTWKLVPTSLSMELDIDIPFQKMSDKIRNSVAELIGAGRRSQLATNSITKRGASGACSPEARC